MEIPDMLASQLVSSLWPPIEMGVLFFCFGIIVRSSDSMLSTMFLMQQEIFFEKILFHIM